MTEVLESRKVGVDGIRLNGRSFNHPLLADYVGKVVGVKLVAGNLHVRLGVKVLCVANPVTTWSKK